MKLGIAGKSALVTGASRGIGRACARALAAEGARVAVCARDGAALAQLVDEMGGAAKGHRAFALDLMADDGVSALTAGLLGDGQSIDLVVHNLGGTLGVRAADAPIADWRRLFRFNLEIAIELDAVLIPPMRARGAGRVVFVSSLAAFEHQGSIPYSVVKAALTAYVRGVGRTHADSGVVVSAVVPGVVMSEGGHWDEAQRRDPDFVESYVRERLPRGKFGTPEEIAAAVAFLCSDHAAPFIGSIVPLEGGQGRSFFGQ